MDPEERPPKSSALNLEGFTLDERCRELVSFIFEKGRSNVSRLTRVGHFDYYVYRPHWTDLLELGIFKMNEQGEFCLTPKAGPQARRNWPELSLPEQMETCHPDNIVDLGLAIEAVKALRQFLPSKLPTAPLEPLAAAWTYEDLMKYLSSLDERERNNKVAEMLWETKVWQSIDADMLAEYHRREQERGLRERISDALFGLL